MSVPPDVIAWLLGEDNPPVRYLTLTNLLGRPAHSAEARRARERLMDYGPTQAIMARWPEFWGAPEEQAYMKYTGRHWQIIFLGNFLADGANVRIAKGVKQMLARRDWVTATGGQCLTANLLGAFMQLGYGEEGVVQAETEALAQRILHDGGLRCSVMDYSLLPRCRMAQPKVLLCFSRIPAGRRSAAIRAAIDLLVQNLLDCEVFVYVPGRVKEWQEVLARHPKRADLPKGRTVVSWIAEQRDLFLKEGGPGERKPKAGWYKFGFPLHYNSDTLEAMYALALLAVPMDPRLRKPLDAVRSKVTRGGKWVLENSLNGKMIADIEEKGKPSKWLTYFGHYVLEHFSPGAESAEKGSSRRKS